MRGASGGQRESMLVARGVLAEIFFAAALGVLGTLICILIGTLAK